MHLIIPVSLLILLAASVAASIGRSHRMHLLLLLLLELGIFPSLRLCEILIVLVDLSPLIISIAATSVVILLLMLLVLLLDALLSLTLHVGQVVVH